MSNVVYSNALATADDLVDWRLEGDGVLSYPRGCLRLESLRPPTDGQAANIVLWCPVDFPDHVQISYNFRPLCEPGLAIAFFSARGRNGRDVFAPNCAPRNGPYDQYHHGDIDALHVSYFRRRNPDEQVLHTCNLRKSHGFHLVAQGADPIPGAFYAARQPYRIRITKSGPHVRFAVDHLELFRWTDPDDNKTGAVLGGGWFGLRQMSPLIGEYSDLRVEVIELLI